MPCSSLVNSRYDMIELISVFTSPKLFGKLFRIALKPIRFDDLYADYSVVC